MNNRFLRVCMLFIGLLIGNGYLHAELIEDEKPIAFYNINKAFKSFEEKEMIVGDVKYTSIKFIDMNHDNLLDIINIRHNKGKYSISVQMNNGNGFETKELLAEDNSSEDMETSWKIDLIDINHDTLPDIVQTSIGNSGHRIIVRLNTTSGFSTTQEWFNDSDSRLKYFKITFIDMNHDGLLDMLQVYRYKCGHRVYVGQNTGNGFSKPIEWLNDSAFKYLSETWTMDIVDVNADGFPDIVSKSIGEEGHQVYVQLNNGSKLEKETLWYSRNRRDLQYWDIQFIDMNGDRLLDLVQVYAHPSGHMVYVAYNTGKKFDKRKVMLYDMNERYQSHVWRMNLVDIDGDGLVDIVNSSIDKSGHQVYRRSNHGKELGSEKFWFSDMRSDLEEWKIEFMDLNNDKLKDIVQTSVDSVSLEVSSF